MRGFRALCVTMMIAGLFVGCGGDDTSGAGGVGAAGGSGGGAGGPSGSGGATAASSSSAGATGGGATGGSGQGGSGGSGGGNGASQACKDCVAAVLVRGSMCLQMVQDCDADVDCEQWKNCGEDCFNADDTPACYDACDAAWPQVTQKAGLYKCTCDACAATCTGTCG